MIDTKENKVWVTFSYKVNLGNFENFEFQSGYSQTIKEDDDPLSLIEEMQENISSIVIDKAKLTKKQIKKKLL